MKSITINGYKITMEDEQYNDVLKRAKEAEYDRHHGPYSNPELPRYPIEDFIAVEVARDIWYSLNWALN